MSGLFQRLASQALGQRASAVRAASRLRARAPLPAGREADEVRARPESIEVDRVEANLGTARSLLRSDRRGDSPVAGVRAMPARADRASLPADRAGGDGSTGRYAQTTDRATEDIHDEGRAGEVHVLRATPSLALYERPAAAAVLAPLDADVGSARSASSTDVTEVHVHIGRIDVIAPPAERPGSRPAQKGVRVAPSLEDYLANRHCAQT